MQPSIHVSYWLHLPVGQLSQQISNERKEDVFPNYMMEPRLSRAYRDQDECWERRSWQKTWGSPRQGRTHTSPGEPCQLFCAVEEKNIFFYRTTDSICLKWSWEDEADFIIAITSTQSSRGMKAYLLLQLLNVLLPVLILLRNLSVRNSNMLISY